MAAITDLAAARPLLEDAVARFSTLVRSAPDLHRPTTPGGWTIQQTAAHFTVTFGLYAELAVGARSPYRSLTPEGCAASSEQRFADLSEDDPDKLAGLLTDAAERFLDETADLPGDRPVTYHCDQPFDVSGLTGVLLGEAVLHGYDLAVALRRPWPISPQEALVVLDSYGPLYHLILNPTSTRELDAAVAIDLRGGNGPVVARFRDGRFGFEALEGPVNATLSADPATFLMVASGRLDRWGPLALGLMEVGGDRPDLAVALPDFFAYP